MFLRIVDFTYAHRKVLAAVFAIYCALLTAAILLGAYFSPSAYDNSDSATVNLNDGWRIVEDDKETTTDGVLPYSIKNKKCKTIELFLTLPETDFLSGVLITTAYQKEVDISLDGALLYSYHPEGSQKKSFTPGSGRFYVMLPQDSAGKELHIRYSRTVMSDDSLIARVAIHDSLQKPFFFVSGSELLLVSMLSLFLIGLVLLIIALVADWRRFLYSPLCSLAVFAISTSVWITCNTKLSQFFTPNLIFLHNLEYIAFFTMPAALWMFAWLTWHYCPRVTLPTIGILSGFLVLALTCKALGLLDFYSFLTLFHLLVLCNFISFVFSLKISYRTGDFPLKMFCAGFGVLAVCCVMEIIRYYFFFSTDTIFSFFIMGIIGLSGCTIASYLYTLRQRMQLQIENSMYKQLAYTDKLTGLRNRLTFEEDMETLEAEQDKYHSIIFANLDVNNFKRVNDTYGHATGDEVLRAVAAELTAICDDPSRRCYRLGGDEFCIIALDNTVNGLNKSLTQMNERLGSGFIQFPITVSFGVAECNKFLHSSLTDVFKSSDDLMYQSKQRRRRAGDNLQTSLF